LVGDLIASVVWNLVVHQVQTNAFIGDSGATTGFTERENGLGLVFLDMAIGPVFY
jgi:hypothetical protein